MIPNKNMAARITFPLITLSGVAEMVFNSGTKMQALWTAAMWFPFLIIGLWLLFIPVYLKFDDEKSQVTIIKVLRKTVIPYDQVERLEKRPSVFAKIYLKSGDDFLFVLEDKDDYQILALSCPKGAARAPTSPPRIQSDEVPPCPRK